jgi:hypothetical protein
MPDQNKSDAATHPRTATRRALLAATGGALAAGCLGDSSDTPTARSTPDTATETPPSTSVGSPTAADGPIHVRDYGADPADEADDTAPIREAFAVARRTPGATVVFEAGEYLVESTEDGRGGSWFTMKRPILDLQGHENLTVEGNGAVLQARNWGPTMQLREVDGLTVRGLGIDWARDLPHTEGIVATDTEEYVDIEVNDAFDVRTGLKAVSLIQFDTDNDRITGNFLNQKGQVPDVPPSEEVGDGVVRMFKSPQHTNTYPEGDGIIAKHTSAGGIAVDSWACGDLTFEDVQLYTAPGIGMAINDTKSLTLQNVAIEPPEGRWKSTARGGTNTSYIHDTISYRNFRNVRTGDDAYNFRGRRRDGPMEDSKTLTIESLVVPGNHEYFPYAAGDTAALSIRPHIDPVATTRTIATVEKEGTEVEGGAIRGTYRITFESAVPQALQDAETVYIYNASRISNSAELVDSYMENMRGGGRISVDNTTIRNCEFVETLGNPVMPNPSPFEAKAPHNLLVEGNHFDTANMTAGAGVFATFTQNFEGTTETYQNITIRNNTFRNIINDRIAAIALSDCSAVTIENNDFGDLARERWVSTGGNVDCETVTLDGSPVC